MSDAYFLPSKIFLPVLKISGELGAAGAADMPLVSRWIENFYRETLHTEPPDLTPRAANKQLSASPESRSKREMIPGATESAVALFVWRDVRPVAMGMLSDEEHPAAGAVCRMNLIYVAPEFRAKGYGRAIVTALAQKSRERGRVPLLYVARENTAAIQLYESLGWRHL
ncbi:MAG: GNAT family N-acetyltransferase [Defluviitaleaceae bacterium]|nr:GNAT family N-acetyltransferase [Defluviitaleaceae bacterium]